MAAAIQINAVTGSNVDLPINVLVSLTNANNTGVTTWAWTLVSQPAGATDVLSSGVAANPTFTPRKEGTYLLRLTTNAGLIDEATNQVVAAVRQLKTLIRVPAAGETGEANTAQGWALDANAAQQLVDATRANPNLRVARAGAGALAKGTVLAYSSVATIKAGLPGEEKVANVTAALAVATLPYVLAVMEGAVDGSGTPANGALCYVHGPGSVVVGLTGGHTAGTPLYCSDTGSISATPGAYRRLVGVSLGTSGGLFDLLVTASGLDDAPEFARLTGGLVLGRKATLASGTYTPTVHEFVIPVDSTNNVTIAPANAARANSRFYLIHDETGNATAKPITIDPEGATLIDGAATVQIAVNLGSRLIYDDGTNWHTALLK